MSETDDSDSEVAKYRFVPDATACDICLSMEGEYEDAPQVPVHFKCNCEVVRLGGAGDDCEYEVIDLEWHEEFDDETRSIATLDFGGPLREDADVSLDVSYGTEMYSFDEGVQEAAEDLGWEEEEHTATISQTVPAGTTSVDVTVDLRVATSTFRGERRKACTTENDDGSVTTTYEYLGSVGGMAIESDLVSFDMHPESDGGGGEGDFFEDDDEVPV
jgi:hypothetical protein